MTDIALFPVNGGNEFDARIANGDIVADDSIRPAVYVSLLTETEYLDSPDGDPRGWWGDAFSSIPGDHIGSLRWLLQRAKMEPQTLADAQRYDKQALQWMLDDDVASAVDVEASFSGTQLMNEEITITGPVAPFKVRLAWLWKQSLLPPQLAIVQDLP